MSEDKTICPHCGQKMKRWGTPSDSSWGEAYWYVCFNDECQYYVRGWDHMFNTMKVKCSYRYKYEPDTGARGPLP
ncbi:MAG: ogr/Delta-like zinc finger family protein, partial [Proteobacteria bacterium]|nr:ogr/Delta-like zinc finger family protein [Pseudomonadota bacterium]